MLHIVCGANYVGKTTTIEILSKQKSLLTFYHPRFNDSQHFSFDYKQYSLITNDLTDLSVHIHRDVVYQISHMTCLKYLTSVKDKKVLLDRCFLSEMCYNSLYDKKIYHEFINILKSTFEYTIYLLTVENDDVLRQRIVNRLEKDNKKRFGVRNEKGFVPEPETIEDKMKSQKEIDAKYRQFIKDFELNNLIIDTSDLSKKEVAKIIFNNIKKK